MPSSSSSPLPTSPTHTNNDNDNDMASGTVAAQQATLRGGKGGTDDTTCAASDLAIEGTRRRVDAAKQTRDQRRKQKMNQSRENDDDDDEQPPRPATTTFIASSISSNLEDFFPPPLSPASTSAASIATAFGEDEETSDQRIARKLESIAKKAIIQQSDSANFDNVINELKNSCSATTTDEKNQQDSSSSSLLKLELPDFSDEVRIQTPPPVVLYDKYPLGDLLRYWFLYAEPYHHLGSDYHGMNAFFRLVTRRKIFPLFDDTTKEKQWCAEHASYQMLRIAKSVYPKVTISDLASSKVSEAVPLRAFKLFDTFENILTTDHSARIAQKNHVAPPGGAIVGTSLVETYLSHWHDQLPKYVFIVDGTAGSGKTIVALEMAPERPHHRGSMNFSHRHNRAKDIVIYINVEDVYFRGKPWKEFGKAHLEEFYRNHLLDGTEYLALRECSYILEEVLVETFDRLLPPFYFKEDVNTEYRAVIVLDDMDRNFARCMQHQTKFCVAKAIQKKLFGPLVNASTDNSDYDRIFRVSFIVIAPSIDEVDSSWPYKPLSAIVDCRRCCIKQSTLDHFSSLKELQDENLAENLRLAEALCSNARCAALLSSALSDSNTQKQLLEVKKENSAVSMKSVNNLLKSIFHEVVREYTKRCGLSKFQHPEKALLVALAISTFHVPLLPRTLQHCPLLRKSLKLVGENDDDDGDFTMRTNATSLYDLLVEKTRLLYDSNEHPRNHFNFTTSPAHLAMIHIVFGIPFSAEKFGDKPTSEKCFLISLVAPYFAEMKRALFLEEFDYEVGVGQSVKACDDALRKKEKDKMWGHALNHWSSVISKSETPAEYAFKEALVFDSIDLSGRPSDVFLFKNDLCMTTEDIDDEEFEQRFRNLEQELAKKWSSSSSPSSNSTRKAFPVFIVCSAEEDTFPQVAVVAPGKVVLTREQKSSHGITTTVVKADVGVDDKSLNNLLASCLGEGLASNNKDESKKQRRSSTGSLFRYSKALQRFAQKLALEAL